MTSLEEPQSSPTLRRRRLGAELRRLREDAGLTIGQVAQHLYCSNSTVSRVETGRISVTLSVVRDMLELYAVGGQQQEAVVQLAREARQKEAWWHAYGDVPDIRTYIGFESAAYSIHEYQSLLIPGLLQVEKYSRTILSVLFPNLHPKEIERYVELRMARQSVLLKDNPPTFKVILHEAAVRHLIGMPEAKEEQVSHLVEVARMSNVDLQVLPFTAGAHGGMIGPFTILSFAGPGDPDVIHFEHPTGDLYVDRGEQVHRYELLFEHLRGVARSPDDSTDFLEQFAREQ